jgi:L-alanine-DL-glutamate epimerase-like enolase superfamily enzyme
MRSKEITAYQFDVPVAEAEGARISGGRSFSGITTTALAIETAQEVTGWGESAPCGPNYLPYIAGAILPGPEIVVPELLGMNPLAIQQINDVMDSTKVSGDLEAGMGPQKTAEGRPTYKDGRIYASDGPGLSVTPLPEILGEPVAVWQ